MTLSWHTLSRNLIAGLIALSVPLAWSCGGASDDDGGSGGSSGGAKGCSSIKNDYQGAFQRARACDPAGDDGQCTRQVAAGLTCGCPTFVNPANAAALQQLTELAAEYEAAACSEGIVCEPCLAPEAAVCSEDGLCTDSPPTSQQQTGCEVDGVVYASGSTGIPDPVSCNTCECSDGELTACTEIACEEPCPEGSEYGTSCARCGPADACEVVEHGCLPTCETTCDDFSVCSNGVCRNVCG